jgi:peptide/nickel transport system permease protein
MQYRTTTIAQGSVRRSRWKIRAALTWKKLKSSWSIFSESKLAVLGLILIGIFALMAISHPILLRTVWPRSIYDPVMGFDGRMLHPSPPSRQHLLGTDLLGRDVLSMLLAATAPTFTLGLTAAIASAVIGTLFGAVAAYYGNLIDTLLSRLSDVFLLLPAPIMMVIVGSRFREIRPATLGGFYGVIAGIGITAIVMRSHALKVKVLPFIEASRVAGGGSLHIIFNHIMPHMLPLAALQMMITVTGAVVADGFVSFLGLTRYISNWGTIIYNAFSYGSALSSPETQFHVLIPPSLALSLFALAFYLVSRGLHRIADPRLHT